MHSLYADDATNNTLAMSDPGDLDQLISEHIEQHPFRSTPDEARTKFAAVPVWALIGHLESVNGDIEQVAEDYDLDVETVTAAVAYYQRHRDAIIARLAANTDSSATAV